MTEAERRRYYGQNKILIEYQRLRDSHFADAVLYFTGVQVELLRNLMQYARQRSGYVSVYGPDSYLIPTAIEWDEIETIVADMEETLMGNPNTIWGYKDRLHAKVTHTQSGAGAYTMTILTVPPDYVYVVNCIVSNNTNRALNHIHQICDSVDCMNSLIQDTTLPGELVIQARVHYVLKEGDTIKAVFTTSQDGDYMVGRAWGYKMAVP